MAITFIGAGTSSTANNAAVTPVAHASTAVGDVVIVVTSVRGLSAATATPSGWLRIAGLANHRAYARVWQTGDSIPAFTPVGGSAGDDVIGQALTFRGVEKSATSLSGGQDDGAVVQANGSAANTAFPAFDMPADRHAAILSLWRQSASTSWTTPSGTTQGVFTSTTTGNDASQSISYGIQLAESDFSSGTSTVTGGSSSVSSALWFYMRPAAAITVTEQDTYPGRVLVSVTGLTIGDSIALYRVIAGQRTLVRAGTSDAVTDPSFLRTDAEIPYGVPISYVAVVNEGVEYATSDVTYALAGGKVAVSDAITGLAAEVVIQSWPTKRRERRSTTFAVGGRNLVVSGALGQFTGQLTLYTETMVSGGNLESLLEGATGGTVQIRQPGGYEGIDCYVVVTGFDQERYDETDGLDERRLWVLDIVETQAWAPELEAAGYTYEELYDAYDGLTYNDLAGDYATYLDLSMAEFS